MIATIIIIILCLAALAVGIYCVNALFDFGGEVFKRDKDKWR